MSRRFLESIHNFPPFNIHLNACRAAAGWSCGIMCLYQFGLADIHVLNAFIAHPALLNSIYVNFLIGFANQSDGKRRAFLTDLPFRVVNTVLLTIHNKGRCDRLLEPLNTRYTFSEKASEARLIRTWWPAQVKFWIVIRVPSLSKRASSRPCQSEKPLGSFWRRSGNSVSEYGE